MLRIRFEGRPHSVKYPDSGRLKDLIAKITEVTGASTESLTVKAGYPPASIGSLTSDRDLLACGIRPGDQVTVETTSRTKSQTATSATEDYESKLTLLPKSSARSDCSVAVDGGHLILRTVPDDNSCLFRSVAIALAGEPQAATSLRSIIANAIREDPETYTDVVLERKPSHYIETILNEKSWGGAIELSIFSKHYAVEITSIDVATGRLDRYGQDSYDSRVLLIYSGIHYDAVSWASAPDIPADFHLTSFPVENTGILSAAEEMARQLRMQGKFTDTANFKLKCDVCKTALKGEKEAVSHMQSTGHKGFSEF